MKNISNKFAVMAVVMASAMLTGCALDAPFGDGGEGSLSITTEINGETSNSTRAVPDNMQELRDQCVIFIENKRGVMRKFKGVDNLPASISLGSGDYVCNAWTGDSVSASFSSKFYRGQQNFTINQDQNTSLLVKCNIANVVVSVDPSALEIGLSDLKITFTTTKGELAFDKENIPVDKGYFMTPSPEVKEKDAEAYERNTTVNVKVEGTQQDGSAYTKAYEIKNVQRAHEYRVSLSKEPGQITDGGALIQLVIKDIPIIEDTVDVFAAPNIRGIGFDIEEPVNQIASKEMRVGIRAFFGIKTATMTLGQSFNNTGLEGKLDLLDADVRNTLTAKGINVVTGTKAQDAETGETVEELYVTISGNYIATLPNREDLFDITFDATDAHDQLNSRTLTFYNNQAAAPDADPVMMDDPTASSDPMTILATKVTLTGMLNEPTLADYGVEYREAGASDWTRVSVKATNSRRKAIAKAKGTAFSLTLTGLKPATTYEYRAYGDDFAGKSVRTFTTEGKFEIPNSSFEEWNTYSAKTMLGTKDVVIPWGVGDKSVSFFGSGNEGSATANITLTNKSTNMVHSGTYSAKLESKSALGMLAAGNLFIGEYVRTDMTDGVLSLGRPYNGSHPTKLRVWVNYRPGGDVSVKQGNEGYIDDMVSGGTDQGQIYVALSVGPVDIRTKESDRKLFNPDDDQILAYGQITWKEAFGPDGQLKMVEIPFTYNERAHSKVPTHLIVTSCASKFGDFFSGSSSSVMYLDDMELIYE